MTSLSTSGAAESKFYQIGPIGRIDRWLHAMPHPLMVVEIAADHVAAARWGSTRGHLEGVAVEALPTGSVMVSTVESNITQPEVVRSALRRVFSRVEPGGAPLALLVPDPVVRVFILPFDSIPRRTEEALPLVRWRLKKSVPFDVEETVVSWTRQVGADGSLELVTGVARQRIVREYEDSIEAVGGHIGVVLSSTLATLPLLEDRGSTLLVRLCGRMLTSVVTYNGKLCVYRSTEMPHDSNLLDPQVVLDEIFPAVAYYQDTWGEPVGRARVTGFGERQAVFGGALAAELKVPVGSMLDSEGAQGLSGPAKDLLQHGLDALAGWMIGGRS